MELKKNVIQKKDYERYAVSIPFRVLLSRNRKRFLFGELEKLHPCFSDECSLESKIRLGKRGLVSDVVVMNSLKLSEYKARFFGKKLFLEGSPEKCVFKNKDWQKKLLIATGFSLVLAVFCSAGVVAFMQHKKAESNALHDEKTNFGMADEVDKTEQTGAEILVGKAPSELPELFLSVVEGDSAFLNELEWVCDGINERFSAGVGYIHPQRLIKACEFELSDVTYKDNVPFFTVRGKTKVRKTKMSENEFVWSNGSTGLFEAGEDDFFEFRKIIESAGAVFLEEKFNPWRIHFVLKNATLDETEALIANMAGFVLKKGIAIKRLVIRKGGLDDFELEIETMPDLSPSMGVNLSLLEKRFRLFGLKNNVKEVSSYQLSVGKNSCDTPVSVMEMEKVKKIGEIRHKDGTFVVYFKNQQGKIMSEVRK